MSHDDPCSSVPDSSASSCALSTCKVGPSQLLLVRNPYWLLLSMPLLSHIFVIRLTTIPMRSFLGVSNRLSGRRSWSVAWSGWIFGLGHSHFLFQHGGILFCSHISLTAAWALIITVSGHSFIMAYDSPLGPGTDPLGAVRIARRRSSMVIGNAIASWISFLVLVSSEGCRIALHILWTNSSGMCLCAGKSLNSGHNCCGFSQSIECTSKNVISFEPWSHSVQCATWVSCTSNGSTMRSPVGSWSVWRSYCIWDFPSIDLIALPIFPDATARSLSADAFCICIRSKLLCLPCIFFFICSSISRSKSASRGKSFFSISLQWVGPFPIMCASSCCCFESNCSFLNFSSHSIVTLLMPSSISSALHHSFLRCAPVICCLIVVMALSAASFATSIGLHPSLNLVLL